MHTKTWIRSIVCVGLVILLAGACGGGGDSSDAGSAPAVQDSSTEDPFALPPLEEPKDCPKPSAKQEISSHSASWAGENGKPVGQFERCLTAPADTPVTITLHNEKMNGVAFQEECNLSVYADPEATDQIVKGKIIPAGKTTTVEVPPLSAGLYLFKCDLHPNSMKGVLVVE